MISTRTMLALAAATSLAFGLACATDQPPVVTLEEITAAQESDDLPALYDRVAADVAALEPGSKAAEAGQAKLADIGSRLADQLVAQVDVGLADARLEDGRVPRDALRGIQGSLAPMERWDAAKFATVSKQVGDELAATEGEIEERRMLLTKLGEDQALERLRVLEQLGELSGTGSAEQTKYVEQRLSILEDMRKRADEALAKEDLDEAQRVLKILQEAEPGDAKLDDKLVEIDEKVFERDFWSALEKGEPDAAYAAFGTLASSPSFETIRPRLEGSADKMATYFATLAAGATEQGNLANAYRRFLQARDVREKLGDESPRAGAEEVAFITRMQSAHEKALAKSQPGLAWGALNVIEELSSMTPALRRQLRETRELVLTAATRRLTAFPFDEASVDGPEFGEAVGSKVIQYLFEAIPQDVRIIEREQLADILREKEIGKGGKGSEVKLASADFLVQGDILEAKVDSVEKTGKKTLRVVTEHKQDRNPKHTWWMALDKDEREDTPEPVEFVDVEVKEDVNFDVTIHRKVGIFSTSYRVIDAQTAKVMFADSVRQKVEHTDESREGIELGEFSMEFKLADLPSDIEILSQLADGVSDEIGKRIADVLRDPEDGYRSSAERFSTEGNYAGAAEQAAYAVVLLERKGKESDALRANLREYAVTAAEAL